VNASIDAEVARLRWRAARLTEAAGRIEAVALDSVQLRSGDETWRGPTAAAFSDSLWRARLSRDAAVRHARTAAGQLLWQADRLREEQLRAGLRS
jgi:hypothetical protein